MNSPRLLVLAATLLLLLLTTTCRFQGTRSPLVQIDNDHYLWREDAKPYLVYQVPAGDEVILDATGYEFDTSRFASNVDPQGGTYSDTDLTPNVVQVVVGLQEDAAVEDTQEPGVYRATWDANSQQHPLNAQTLLPVSGSAPFTQFEPGQRIIVEVGHLEKDEATGRELFYSFWGGMIDVQQNEP